MAIRRRLIILLCLFTVLVMANPVSAATSTRTNDTEDFVDDTSNLHLETPDIGTHSVFGDLQDYGANYDQMQEANTGAAGNDIEQFVQAQTNAGDPTDIGTHAGGGFVEMQDKDGTFDLLTEANTGSAGGTTEYIAELFTDSCGQWASENLAYDGDWGTYATNPDFSDGDDYPSAYASSFDSGATGSGTITQVDIVIRIQITLLDNSDEWGITLDVGASTGNVLQAMNKNNYALNNLTFTDVTEPNGGGWSWAEVQSAQVHIDGERVGGSDNGAFYVYEFAFKVTTSGGDVFDMDLEVGWTTADYDETTGEELCIFGGTMATELLRVDVWTGTWTNLDTDIVAGWNNISVTAYLTDATFEIRFTDTSNDATLADDWEIEGVLLHCWTDAVTNYELDLEIGWTVDTDFDETEEWLCIFPVTGGGWPSEAIKVDIWDGTWTNLWADLTPDQWNNISIASYLTSVDVEVRFLGGIETGDTTQDTFEIDAVLIHTYSYAYTESREEAMTVDETIDTAAGFARDFSESINIDDSISTLVTIVKALFEALAVAASLTTTVSLKRFYYESITLSPTFNEIGTFARQFFENMTLDETSSTQLIIQKFLFEAVVVTAAISTTVSFSRRLGESIVLSPTFNEVGTFVRDYFEGITFADHVEATKTGGGTDYVKELFESITLTDSESLAYSLVRVLSESIIISDTTSTTFIGLWIKNLFESFLFGENDVWADYRAVTTTTTFNPDKRRVIIPPIFPPNLVLAGLGVGSLFWIYLYGVPYIKESEATAYTRREKLKWEIRRQLKPILGPLERALSSVRRKTKRKTTKKSGSILWRIKSSIKYAWMRLWRAIWKADK